MVSIVTGMSLEEFTRLYDQEGPFELVDGERVPLSLPTLGQATTANRLMWPLSGSGQSKHVGEVFAQAVFIVETTRNLIGNSYVPDVMYIRAERLAAYKQANSDWKDKPLALVPDVVVEIVSPTDRYTDVNRKIAGYLADGVQLAWVLDQKRRTVAIHQPGSNQITVLTADQTLTGGSVIEGFEVKVAELFE